MRIFLILWGAHGLIERIVVGQGEVEGDIL